MSCWGISKFDLNIPFVLSVALIVLYVSPPVEISLRVVLGRFRPVLTRLLPAHDILHEQLTPRAMLGVPRIHRGCCCECTVDKLGGFLGIQSQECGSSRVNGSKMNDTIALDTSRTTSPASSSYSWYGSHGCISRRRRIDDECRARSLDRVRDTQSEEDKLVGLFAGKISGST